LAEVIGAVPPPVRVTLAEIERQLGRHSWIRKHRSKLLLANSEVDAVAEPVVVWRVMRAAGMTRRDLPMIKEMIAAAASRADRDQAF
jgi:hypothetical protein